MQSQPPSGSDTRWTGIRRAAPVVLGLIFVIGPLVASRAARAADSADWRRPAVAATNVRVSAGYDYVSIDKTRTSYFGSGGSATLSIDEVDTHAGYAELVATLPVTHSSGARGRVRAGFGDTRRSLDALDPDESDASSYGVELGLFVRDPKLGSVTFGGSYDRLEGDGGVDANAFGGSVEAAIFFPDLGSGYIDWFARFDFTHRRVSGAGQPFDVDADVYRVAAGAGWYATEDIQVLAGGRWTRTEEEFLSEDDREGFLTLRWRLPLPLSLEVSASGSAGLSEYKQAPFRGDHRLIYGARVGFIYRFRSGPTLRESIRAYD
ncbi:MAG: hypothetical protein CL908_25865 [Deltaproteobacteria bacterium]|nr:hypothetical protein [Deltaproteobacteria bacterium]